MFEYEDEMCCTECFVEMTPIISKDLRPLVYICPNCGKLTTIVDEI